MNTVILITLAQALEILANITAGRFLRIVSFTPQERYILKRPAKALGFNAKALWKYTEVTVQEGVLYANKKAKREGIDVEDVEVKEAFYYYLTENRVLAQHKKNNQKYVVYSKDIAKPENTFYYEGNKINYQDIPKELWGAKKKNDNKWRVLKIENIVGFTIDKQKYEIVK